MDASDHGELGGAIQGGIVYAPADFPEVDMIDSKPHVNISTAVSNVILFHVSDAVDKQNHHSTWKRQICEK